MIKKPNNTNCKVACITGPKYISIHQQYISVWLNLPVGVAHPGGKILKSDLKIYLLSKRVLTQFLSTLSLHTTLYIMYK
jgi:hypothetical protein